MKKTVKSLTVLIVSAMMIICTCLCTAYAAEGDNYLQSGNMDLDVMFVLDASGSMLTSDPNKIALDAVNLFIDLTDESCGAGYVVYTEKIKASSDIVSFKDKSNLESMKKEIAGLSYDPNGDTDIALGLTNAMNTFKDKGEANGRKRAIILLSDGNTHLLNGPRTVEQSKAEMEDTLKELSKMDVPVYTIGLNYDGTLDKQETERIATATKGKAFSTKTSDDLPNVLSDIFSSIYKLEGKQLALVNGNVRIKVENSSIFYVNIIIKSNFTAEELNPKLKNPNKEDVPIEGNENVKMTSAGTYTLIKLIYPMTGDWKLHIDNATEENCRITQLDFYSVYIKQTLDDKAGVNRPYQIQATLNEGDVAVRDFALLNTINMVSTITTEDGEEQVELTCDENGVFVGQFIPKKTGEITIQTKAVTKTFEKDSVKFKVTVLENYEVPMESSIGEIEPEVDDSAFGLAMRILTYIGIGILVVVAIIAIILIIRAAIKAKAEKTTIEPPAPPPPPPPPQPAPAPKPKPVYIPEPPAPKQPEAKPPEYVDIPLLEHAPLEELIKRGADNSFNKNADEFETDHDLEKIVKKGTDDAFNMSSADSYSVDPSLAALIKTGGDGLEGNGIQKEEPQEETDEEQ